MSKKDKAEKYQKKLGKLLRKQSGDGLEILVCTDTRKDGCAERGGKQVLKALRHELARLGLEETICARACDHFGPCKHGPNLVVSPAGTWHTHVTPDDVPAILRRLLAGEDVAPLLVEEAAV